MHAYFKGGTALYRALKSVRRFSEGIDLTVQASDCPSQSQRQRRLEKAVLKFKSLEKQEALENKRSTITCLYKYDSVFKDLTDPLRRFGSAKVEGTSFTVSKPNRMLQIAPYLYELAEDDEKKILEDAFDVLPFYIPTISMERIFIDKVFALEYYFARGMFQYVSKHAYDLAVLFVTSEIQNFLKNKTMVKEVKSHEREEQDMRFGGIPSSLLIQDFTVFDEFNLCQANEEHFERMQNVFVFDQGERLELKKVLSILQMIRRALSES